MADETTTAEVPILSRLRAPKGAVTKKLRVGRGPGSGLGKTAGRGQKGQKARQPGNIHKLHFEGGQMPLNRRLPKVGFNSPFPRELAAVNVSQLEVFEAGTTVDEAALRARGLVKGRWDGVKWIEAEMHARAARPERIGFADVVWSIATETLTVPHPRLHQRAFVLRPLLDVLPGAHIPGLGPAADRLPDVAGQVIFRI